MFVVAWGIADAVLASQFLSDLIKNFLETVLVIHDECRSAGLVRQFPVYDALYAYVQRQGK